MTNTKPIQIWLLPILFTAFSRCIPMAKPEMVQPLPATDDTTATEVHFLHWNDFHSANTPYLSRWGKTKGLEIGGYATLAGYIDSMKALYPAALVLNAGDDFQGSPISALTKGMSQILILNEIQPSAFTIGNHEFDYGMKNLRNAVDMANFEILSCNLFDSTSMSLFTMPYTIAEYNNINVGIIGMILGDLKSTVLPGNMEKIAVLDPLESVRNSVTEIGNNADLIVLLTHNGFYEDSLLATELQEVDVIFGGHSHTILRKPVIVNNILICQAGSRGQFLGHLRASVDLENNSITAFDYQLVETVVNRVSPSADVARIVDSLEITINTEMDRIIGELKTPWVRNSRGESNIGSWIANATREYFNADIAFQNSGGIRKGLDAGKIRVRDIWEISPFDNTIVLVKLRGDQLVHLLNWRITNPRDLLQQSGIRRVYDAQQKTLLEATVRGKPIAADSVYTLATNNYVVGHIDRFFGLSSTDVGVTDTGIIGRDILIEAVEKQGVIDSRTDGRLFIRGQ
jgi:2',3'-cyclic-nucleotide 2'-phosphodiesterase (5'-nucleotidase family)